MQNIKADSIRIDINKEFQVLLEDTTEPFSQSHSFIKACEFTRIETSKWKHQGNPIGSQTENLKQMRKPETDLLILLLFTMRKLLFRWILLLYLY